MASTITLDKSKRQLADLLGIADRQGDVYIVVKNRTYHLHRELTEDEAVSIGNEAEKEYKAGKTRSFDEFIISEFPEYAGNLENNEN